MTSIAIVAVGALIAAALSVACVHPGAALMTRLLGRDRCLPADSANGCLPWFLGAFVSLGIVTVLEDHVGWGALAAAPAGPIVAILVVAFDLRFAERGHRRTEFLIRDGNVVAADGSALAPRCVLPGGDYTCTGPGGGYVLYSLTLHDGEKALAFNGYVAEAPYLRDKRALTEGLGLLAIDLFAEWQRSDIEWLSVPFSKKWAIFLVQSGDRLPPVTRDFWLDASLARLGPAGSREVSADVFLGHLSAVADLLHPTGSDSLDDYLTSNIERLRRLVTISGGGTITLITPEAHVAVGERRKETAGASGTQLRFEDSIGVNTLIGGRVGYPQRPAA